MSTTSLRNLALVLIALTVSFSSAFAHEDKRVHQHARARAEHREHSDRRVEHRNWERSRTREHWRQQRTRWEAQHRANEHRPKGWDKGHKTGWGGNNVPPGQAKKDAGSVPAHSPDRSGQPHTWAGNRGSASNTQNVRVNNVRVNKDPRDSNTKMASVSPLAHKR